MKLIPILLVSVAPDVPVIGGLTHEFALENDAVQVPGGIIGGLLGKALAGKSATFSGSASLAVDTSGDTPKYQITEALTAGDDCPWLPRILWSHSFAQDLTVGEYNLLHPILGGGPVEITATLTLREE